MNAPTFFYDREKATLAFSDRELLVLAARAVGFRVDHATTDVMVNPHGVALSYGGSGVWSPLEDNADAFLLAVKLHLHLGIEDACANAWSPRVGNSWSTEVYKGDPAAATRRAIVRAAAAVGATA